MNLKQYIAKHTIQWDHPKLDIVVQFYVEDGYIEVEHVFGYVYGKQCIANLFNHDKLIDDWQASTAYDLHLETGMPAYGTAKYIGSRENQA